MREFLSESLFRQHLLVLFWAVLISLVASVPYIYGFLRENKTPEVYLGRSIVNSADTYIFLSHIESVKQGEILLPNLYTSSPRDAFFIKPIYIFIGLIARIFNLNSLLIFHISRFFLSILFFGTLWVLVGFFFSRFKDRFLAMTLVSTSTGLGFLLKDKLPSSIDLWVPEANTFFSITEAPHFIWSQIGILIIVITLLKFRLTGKIVFLATGSVFSSLVVLEHPYLIPFLLLLPPLFLIISSNKLSDYLVNSSVAVALPLLFAVLLYIFFQNSSGLAQYSKQVVLSTPSILNVLSGYGLLIPLGVYGIIRGKIDDSAKYLLVIWFSILALSIYMPFSFQRRLLEGLHLPIAISAALALVGLSLKNNFAKLLLVGLLVFLSLGNIYMIEYSIREIRSDTGEEYSYHIYKGDLEGLLWIRDNSAKQDLILSNFYYSNIIPGITGRYVYSGHLFNTVDSKSKSALYDKFITGNKLQRKSFIEANNPRFIFFGKVDPYKPFKDSLLADETFRLVWSKNDVYILEVKVI